MISSFYLQATVKFQVEKKVHNLHGFVFGIDNGLVFSVGFKPAFGPVFSNDCCIRVILVFPFYVIIWLLKQTLNTEART